MSNAPPGVVPAYSDEFKGLLSKQEPIKLHFNTVEAFPAAIILKAYDDEFYKRLRDQFNQRIELPEARNLRQPSFTLLSVNLPFY
jgi:hypothetical protein